MDPRTGAGPVVALKTLRSTLPEAPVSDRGQSSCTLPSMAAQIRGPRSAVSWHLARGDQELFRQASTRGAPEDPGDVDDLSLWQESQERQQITADPDRLVLSSWREVFSTTGGCRRSEFRVSSVGRFLSAQPVNADQRQQQTASDRNCKNPPASNPLGFSTRTISLEHPAVGAVRQTGAETEWRPPRRRCRRRRGG